MSFSPYEKTPVKKDSSEYGFQMGENADTIWRVE
jgi:hypothetical protein